VNLSTHFSGGVASICCCILLELGNVVFCHREISLKAGGCGLRSKKGEDFILYMRQYMSRESLRQHTHRSSAANCPSRTKKGSYR
jgi:hypothetical protein